MPARALCLLEHGRLLTGTDVRTGLPRPDRADLLVAGAEFALEALAGDVLAQARRPESLLAAGIRWTTTIMLFPVRFLVTAETAHRLTSDVRGTLDTPSLPDPSVPERWAGPRRDR